MKIRLFIVEQDENYLGKIASVFNSKYSDKLEVYAFSDAKMAMDQASLNHADVVVAGSDLGLTPDDFPIGCGFAFLTDQPGITKIDDIAAINKYQRADVLYKEILDCYAQDHGNVSGKSRGGKTKLYVFTSPAGGTGTSSLAVAAAKKATLKGDKCLYFNLEKYGNSDLFFAGEGTHNFSELIYALKSRKANLELKMESSVKQDASGVFFFSPTENAMDMLELTGDERKQLVDAAVNKGAYDCVILDIDYGTSSDMIDILAKADCIVETSDGSQTANVKIARAFDVLKVVEQEKGLNLTGKCILFYNKFSNKVSEEISGCDIKCVGGAPKFEHASLNEVVKGLVGIKELDEII